MNTLKIISTTFFTITLFINLSAQKSQSDSIIKYEKDSSISVNSNYSWEKKGLILSKDFNQRLILSPLKLIQGKVPGLAIYNTHGNDPTSEFEMYMRGINTINGDRKPLIVIDGIPQADLKTVVAENIESFEVLRDVAECAIYGIRGSNGVVLIQTKKGSIGKPIIMYSTFGYYEEISKKPTYLSASEWRQYKQDWSTSSNTNLRNWSESMIDYNGSTDWYDEIMQNKLSQLHFLELNGGFKNTTYLASITYRNLNGKLKELKNEALNLHLQLTQSAFHDKLKATFSLSRNTEWYTQNGRRVNEDYGQIENALRFNPTSPSSETVGAKGYGFFGYLTPLASIDSIHNSSENTHWLANARLSFEIIKGLTTNLSYALQQTDDITDESYVNQYYVSSQRWYNSYNKKNKTTFYELSVGYTMQFNKHTISLFTGYSVQNFDKEQSDRIIYFDPNYIPNEFNDGGTDTSFNKQWIQTSIISFLNKCSYSFDNRLDVSFILCGNRSSKSADPDKTKFFPSVSAAWNLKNENFLEHISWINNLSFITSYGETGNQLPSFYPFNYSMVYNVKLKDESLNEFTFGLNTSLFSNKIQFTVDKYYRTTKQVYIIHLLPPSTNYPTILTNGNDMKNRGWEIQLSANLIEKREFLWKTIFIYSYNKNTAPSDYMNSEYSIIKNEPYGTIYRYKFAGLNDTNEILIYDESGKSIRYSSNNKELSSINTIPTTYLGFSNYIKYKQFDLAINVRGAFGFKIENLHYSEFSSIETMINKQNIYKNNSLVTVSGYQSLPYTDYFIEKGDYLKIDNITLGYNLSKIKQLKSARIYISCNNVKTFTSFTGTDPEVAGISDKYTYDQYPVTRIYMVGATINF